MALHFDDKSLPIQFDVIKNDDEFTVFFMTNEFMLDLADGYAHHFDTIDFSPGDTITLAGPLTIDTPESE